MESRGHTMWERHKRPLRFLLDICALLAAFVLAYLLRFDFEVPVSLLGPAYAQAPFVILTQVVALQAVGANRLVWRYIGLGDLPAYLKAATSSLAVIVAVRFAPLAILDPFQVPLSVALLDALFAFAGIIGLRVVRRAIHENHRRSATGEFDQFDRRERVLLVGAGHAGVLAAREIAARNDIGVLPVGFVDDDPLKRGFAIGGIRVLGSTRELPDLVLRHDVDHVIITIADTARSNIRRIVKTCEQVPIRVRTIPGYFELLRGVESIQSIQDIDVDTLLGRDVVELDEHRLAKFLADKRVMITGAGGSIGSEIAFQVARFSPRRLILVERAEPALFATDRKLRGSVPEVEVVPLVADVGDEARMRALLSERRPEIIVHAAAHKHVPLMEVNVAEAIKNNVFGTSTLARLAGELGVDEFVLVSTDKAVRPTSVMGASKRLAELLIQDCDREFDTRFAAVRFGNVIGSAGSVLPIFEEQIRQGGPITVTHPDMVRYFMSIPEAAQLVLSAASYARGGEIFVLDMGDSVSILDLAEKMVRFAGFEPHRDIEIEFTGMRPGEKLAEELATEDEKLLPTANAKIFIGKLPTIYGGALREGLAQLRDLVAAADEAEIRLFLNRFLPEARIRIGDEDRASEVHDLDEELRGAPH